MKSDPVVTLKIRPLQYFKYVTLEPTLFFYFLSVSVSNFVGGNLLLRKACDPTRTTIVDPVEPCLDEKYAQHRVASINSWKVTLTIILSTVVVLIAGAWSDKNRKRKPLLLIPVVGHIITDLACCINVYFWSWPPEIAAFCESVIPGITGHRNCFWIGAMCYMADITTEKNRTLRIGIASTFYYVCAPIGAGIAGSMNIKFGFMGTFLISILFNVIGLVCGIYFIRDSLIHRTTNNDEVDRKKKDSITERIFESYKVFTKPRLNENRLKICCISLLPPLVISRMIGENTVLYLFVRKKFGWNEVDYSYFTAYKMVTILFGTLFSIGLLSHRLRINDALIGVIGTAVDTVAAFLYFSVASPWQMYLIPLIDMFNGAALTLATSISTKCVESDELGKLNTMQAVLSAIFPMVICPLYSQVYSFTLEKMASAFFGISVIISIPTIVLFSAVYYVGLSANENTKEVDQGKTNISYTEDQHYSTFRKNQK